MSRDGERALHVEPGLDRARLARFHPVEIERGRRRPGSRSKVANPSQPITPVPPNAEPSIRPFKRMRALLRRPIRGWPRGCWK